MHLHSFGALNIHGTSALLGSLLLLLLWTFATTLGPALAFVIIFGAVSGSIIGLPPASIAYILGRADFAQQAKLGQWTGMMYTFSAPFALTGPVIAGFLISEYGPNNYLTVQLWSGACLFAAGICMAIARYSVGPSRTVDLVKDMAATISRVTTLERDDEKGGVLSGLRRKIVGDGEDTSEDTSEESSPASSGDVTPTKNEETKGGALERV